ncbi:MAG: DUF134 domain-containing protein [Candidatus Omnitrophica bacterium]|nr:DUF134 domain-containing protein [Candidatus Omnitrophota bacterium]
MDPRGRPKKYKIVRNDPHIWRFSPRGKAGRPEEIDLKIEEFEAFRLSDNDGLKQAQAAELMRISQQTFSRLLKKARTTLADALVNGKIIKIQGGCYVLSTRQNNNHNNHEKHEAPRTQDRIPE